MTNLAIIRSTYEGASASEQGAALSAHSAEDIRWTEAAGFPYAGTYVGLSSVQAHVFSRLDSDWQDFRFEVETYVSSEDKVVAIGTYKGTYKATNVSFSARATHVWQLRDGKIRAFEQFVDSKSVVDAMQ
ncbi:nuclear transport factor 2 family protein [Flexibacter flexilis]|nr:nuclear transport factor 2 family protein [Flexibacter flexilis]